MENLHEIAKKMVEKGKGILAADESSRTVEKRLSSIGVENSEENRKRWRSVLLLASGIEKYLSGVILFDETIRQESVEGGLFTKSLEERGIIPGIKVDQGTVPFENSETEVITQGLEGLPERLKEYYEMGARFTKWRGVIRIGEGIPTDECIRKNAEIFAKYALESQKAGLVPMVEPEVLLDGDHTIERCEEVVTNTLRITFEELKSANVDLKGLILKSSMVLAGKDSGQSTSAKQVAEATVRAFRNSVPEETAGIVFLSGGQTPEQATENLNEVAKIENKPWPITFSFSRAIQDPVLKAWTGDDLNIEKAREIFLERLEETASASIGEYISKN